MPALAELDEDERAQVVERWAVLRPHVEDGFPLTEAAAAAGVPLRTAQRWLARYRDGGLAALARDRRSDRGVRRLHAELITVIEARVALLPDDPDDTGQHHLLTRRNDTTGELAYHRCQSPRPVTLSTLVRVAGQRWRVEESFQAAKGLTGLDQHQVRRWVSWHRWTTLALFAHAFLAVATAAERTHAPAPAGLIELTLAEFRRLFDALLLHASHTIDTLLGWSRWRRRHQARARHCHHKRREHH
jgi:hypothetical protein